MTDLHTHSCISDGTDAPGDLLRKARASGLRFFALTDHDTTGGVGVIEEEIRRRPDDNFLFIRGIEFSCKARSGKCHLLGYDYDPQSGEFQRALALGRRLRQEKLKRRLDFLQENFGVAFSEAELRELRGNPSSGKPHLANLMVKKGFGGDIRDAITNYINKCPTGNTRIDAETAVRAILAAGGLPVWAHPLGGEGEPELPEEKFTAMLDELTGYGLRGLECYYSKYTLGQAEGLARAARSRGLLVSGGSDYHGGNKAIPIGRLNAEGEAVPPEALTILNVIMERKMGNGGN